MKKSLRNVLIIFLLIDALLVGLWFFVPFKNIAAGQVQQLLEKQGLSDVTLRVESLNPSRLIVKDIAFKKDNNTIAIAQLTLDGAADFSKQSFSGAWQINDVQVTTGQTAWPALSGRGTHIVDATAAKIDGVLESADKRMGLDFTFGHIFPPEPAMHLMLRRGFMHWQGGVIALNNTNMPLGQTIRLPLQVKNIPLKNLLDLLTGGQADATGTVSGTLPVTMTPDGKVALETGALVADTPGLIKLQDSALPGDQDQVALVRTLLKNLHYTDLSIKTAGLKNNTMQVLLSVEGKNPDAMEGRPVKLNVQLSGDLLGLLQQNIMLLTDPKNLLKNPDDKK